MLFSNVDELFKELERELEEDSVDIDVITEDLLDELLEFTEEEDELLEFTELTVESELEEDKFEILVEDILVEDWLDVSEGQLPMTTSGGGSSNGSIDV